jgi:2-amino-4-hydroxy-6-hydroxymethyldihydropteridine diphosphokinase
MEPAPMSTCLIALGSNLGDRAATLDAAIAEITSLAGVTLFRHSRWHSTQPIGRVENLHEFLNGAALCETTLKPDDLLAGLQAIESRFGRERTERWADRTLDLDLLLYDEKMIETPTLTIPHPRMSYRRFVLEPAAEIAGQLVHPTIGWTLDQLLQHLDAGANCLAVVSPNATRRAQLTQVLREKFPDSVAIAQRDLETGLLWPANLTIWLSVRTSLATPATSAAAKHPKLTILLDPDTTTPTDDVTSNWTAICRQKGRGPTLRIPATSVEEMSIEAFAAVQTVWPALGPSGDQGLE